MNFFKDTDNPLNLSSIFIKKSNPKKASFITKVFKAKKTLNTFPIIFISKKKYF